jgi:hypothetical protein
LFLIINFTVYAMKTVEEILFALSYVTIGQILRGSEYETEQVNDQTFDSSDIQGKDQATEKLV